jgi:membrane-associated protein
MQYLHIILHLDVYLTSLISQYGVWAYGILFLIIFCESGLILTPILPGESLLFALGTLAAKNAFNLFTMMTVLIIAAIIGGLINYCVGYFLGHKIFPPGKKNMFSNYVQRTHLFYERHGGKTIILARFVPIIRTYAPFVAGIAEMNFNAFFLFNIVGGVVWIVLFLTGSYFFGNIPIIRENFSLVILTIICLSVVPIIFEFIKAQRKSR